MQLGGINATPNAGPPEESPGEISGGRFIDILPPDKPGDEMTKEARVWKTYVWETDRWDKELVGGRNSSLDVLLIFAALFSAISTAFVLVSITDLKPDYAESSAQTLLAISQMLSVQVNPQNASLVAPGPSDTPSFSPSSAAILVNSLWMLSLSLSVAVSLIAMLAKDWCYKFTSSRSGPAYDQARRRQRKWNGIEKWKMNEVLTYLPGMLHLALLLFAIGLCLYLWDINVTVAIPVVVVTGSATLLYILATVLPYVDHSCPYSTPASGIFTAINKITTLLLVILAYALGPIIPSIQYALVDFIPSKIDSIIQALGEQSLDMIHIVIMQTYMTGGLALPLGLLIIIIATPLFIFYGILWLLRASITLVTRVPFKPLAFSLRKIFPDAELDDAYDGKEKVPMNTLTSKMLAWLLSNCEDSRSVDIALQAIAGADHNLPHQPLKDCGVFGLVLTRLDAYIQWDNKLKKYTVKDPSQLFVALRYCRTYSTLTFGGAHQAYTGGQSDYYRKSFKTSPSSDLIRVHSIYADLLKQAQAIKDIDSDVVATAAAVAMPFSDWNWPSRPNRPDIAPETAVSILTKHFQSDCTLLSPSSLTTLAEFVPHYLLWAWSRKEQGDSQHLQHLLPIMLAQLFLKHHDTKLEVARSSAIALASVAFVTDDYHGGERPPKDLSDRKIRAAQVLEHYQAKPPVGDTVPALFIFGFYGLLPHLKFDLVDEHLPDLLGYLDKALRFGSPRFNLKDNRIQVHGIPRNTLRDYTLNPALDHLASLAQDTSNDTHQITAAFRFKLLPLLIHAPQSASDADPRVYGLALIVLCRAKHKVLQDLCMNIIDEQPIPVNPVRMDAGWEEKLAMVVAAKEVTNLLGQLCGTLMANETPVVHVAILHFELLVLVACIIPSKTLPFEKLQSALRPLLSSHDEFTGLKGSGPLSLDTLFSDLEKRKSERRTRDSVLRMMRYVADFCDHGLTPDKTPGGASDGRTIDEEQAGRDWYAKLEKLKKAYKPSAEKVERLNPGDATSSSSSNRNGAIDQEAGASLHGIALSQPAT